MIDASSKNETEIKNVLADAALNFEQNISANKINGIAEKLREVPFEKIEDAMERAADNQDRFPSLKAIKAYIASGDAGKKKETEADRLYNAALAKENNRYRELRTKLESYLSAQGMTTEQQSEFFKGYYLRWMKVFIPGQESDVATKLIGEIPFFKSALFDLAESVNGSINKESIELALKLCERKKLAAIKQIDMDKRFPKNFGGKRAI